MVILGSYDSLISVVSEAVPKAIDIYNDMICNSRQYSTYKDNSLPDD